MDCQSSPSSRRIWNYDVFLSFRVEDSHDFTSYLYFALLKRNIRTFVDDKLGESNIAPKLRKAIEESRISIVVFSRNYAASTRCLDELAKMAECHDLGEQIVLPVFYDVDPSEVKEQRGVYQQAFAEHEERFKQNLEKVERWRKSMTKVAKLSGWYLGKKVKTEVVDNIVRKAMNVLLDEASRIVNDELVGIQPRVEALENLLDLGSDDLVRIVGICGVGGIGKSTLATVLYDRISHKFDACCFLANLSNVSESSDLSRVQEKLLRKTLDQENLKIRDVDEGTLLMGTSLRHLKTLIVLDDVDDLIILEKLAGSPFWFGTGSRIIITTRKAHILRSHGVDGIYTVEPLREDEAFGLFSRLTSKLNDMEREMFIDIACFFVGEKINYVMEILRHCEFYPEFKIEVLIEKSIITILDQKIQMHYMLQELGQKFARQEFPEEPGKRSRLWFDEDSLHVLETNTGTENVKALVLNPKSRQETALRAEALSKMSGLRLLIFQNVNFSGVLNDLSLSNELRYVSWHKYPFSSLPSSFEPDRLVELIMPDSRITQLWEGLKILHNLRNMDLGGSKNLNKMPDFRELPNLTRLNLEGCTELLQLDPSIAFLKKLKVLNLRNCKCLASIPNSLFVLSSLEIINMAGCSKLAECLNFNSLKSSIEVKLLSNQYFALLAKMLCFLFISLPEDIMYDKFVFCCLICLIYSVFNVRLS